MQAAEENQEESFLQEMREMYAAIRRYQVSPNLSEEIIRLILEDFAPQVSSVEGYISYNIVDEGNGKILTISVFQNRAGVLESSDLAVKWMGENLSKFISRSADATHLKVEEFIEGSYYGETAPRPTYEQVLQPEVKATSPNGSTKLSDTQGLQLFSVEDLCELLGVGKSWVYKRLKTGEIPSVKVGRAFRVRHEELEEYLEKQRYSR